jgi:hypothetical protein
MINDEPYIAVPWEGSLKDDFGADYPPFPEVDDEGRTQDEYEDEIADGFQSEGDIPF